jgi:hypothetical protein
VRPDEDPGWVPSTRNGLSVLRLLFVVFLGELGVLAVVAFFVAVPAHGEEDPASWPWIMLGVGFFGAGASLVVHRLARRPLRCADLAASYRTRTILCLAIAESVALAGFAGAVVAKTTLMYTIVGLPLSGTCFALFAPTRANIERDHEQLRADGCIASIYEALATPTAS